MKLGGRFLNDAVLIQSRGRHGELRNAGPVTKRIPVRIEDNRDERRKGADRRRPEDLTSLESKARANGKDAPLSGDPAETPRLGERILGSMSIEVMMVGNRPEKMTVPKSRKQRMKKRAAEGHRSINVRLKPLKRLRMTGGVASRENQHLAMPVAECFNAQNPGRSQEDAQRKSR